MRTSVHLYLRAFLYEAPDARVRSHEITSPLMSDRLLTIVPTASPLQELEARRRTITVTPLLETSSRAWARSDVNAQATLTEPLPSEIRGTFVVAAAITDRAANEQEKNTKIVVITTSDFVNPQFMTQVPGNLNFLMNTLNWLYDRDEPISVRPKSLIQFRLRLSGLSSLIFSGVVVILIPLGVLVAGPHSK